MEHKKDLNLDGVLYSVGKRTTVLALIEGITYAHTTDVVSNLTIFAGTTFIYFLGGKVYTQNKWGASVRSNERRKR